MKPTKGGASEPNPELLPKIQKIIAHQLKKQPEEVTLEAQLQKDLGADSLDALEIIMNIEEEFNIDIPETEARSVVYVKDIVNYVVKKVEN